MRRLLLVPILAAVLLPAALRAEDAACRNGNCYGDGAAADCPNCNGDSLIARLRCRCNAMECRQKEYGDPDLFYNFWQPPVCDGVGAQMYIAPQPVPANVGHTYYTYQPFMPHEMLYDHHRTYHRYYDEGRGLTRASIRWYKSPLYKVSNFQGFLAFPR